MAQIIQEIKVELSKPNFFQAIVAKQFDSGSRFLKVTFVHENEKISIEGPAEVCINAKRSDGEKKSFEGQVNDDGTATVPLAYWMLELVGTVNCDISVLSGESRLTTTTFILEVQEASNIPDDVSEDENYDALLSLIERVENIEKIESTDNKTYEITKDSKDEQYPSAKAVYDVVKATGDAFSLAMSGKQNKINMVTNIDENSTVEQYPSAKAVYDVVKETVSSALGTVTHLKKEDFTVGAYVNGVIDTSYTYWITMKEPVKVNVGDKITIIPSPGARVLWRILDKDAVAIKTESVTEETVFLSEYEGYFIAQIQTGSIMTPEVYDCTIVVNSSPIEIVKEDVETLFGLVEDSKNITRLAGKKIVNFGDSIFGKYRDASEEDKSISTMLSEQTGAICYNAGFGGCTMTRAYSPFRGFSMCSLADSINSGSWVVQEEDLESGVGRLPEYFSDTVEMLKSIDWNDIDIITIAYGVNDYSVGRPIKEADGSFVYAYDYYKGALRYSVEKILSAYPHIKVAVITPLWKWVLKDGKFDYSSDDVEKSKNSSGYTLIDYVDACIDVAKELHLPYVDNYYNLGINEYNYSQYFNSSDGTHPNKNGRQLCANNILSKLLFI